MRVRAWRSQGTLANYLPPPSPTSAALPSPGLLGVGPRERGCWPRGRGEADTHGVRPHSRGHSYYLLGPSSTLQACISKARWAPLNLKAASWAQTQPFGDQGLWGRRGDSSAEKVTNVALTPPPHLLRLFRPPSGTLVRAGLQGGHRQDLWALRSHLPPGYAVGRR